MGSLIKFLRHEPCPSCRQQGKDKRGNNLARYVNGKAFCFACGYREKSQQTAAEIHTEPVVIAPQPPTDLSKTLPAANYNWLRKYLSHEQIMGNFWYSKKLDRHLFRFLDFYEARSVTGAEPKTYCVGEKPPLVFAKVSMDETLVLVEDVVSAIKLSEVVPAMPLFGTGMNTGIRDFLHKCGYSDIIIWLDRDKYDRSLFFRKYLQGCGKQARVISTNRDPKDYTVEELQLILEGEYVDETSFSDRIV